MKVTGIKNILVMTNGVYYPYSKEAPGLVIARVLEELSRDGGYNIDVHYVVDTTQSLADIPKAFDRIALSFVSNAKFTSRLCSVLRLIPSIRSKDLIIFNSPPIGMMFLVLAASFICKRKVIFVAHGGFFIESPKAFSIKLQYEITKYLLRDSNALIQRYITVSKDMSRIIKRQLGSVKVDIIYNGIDSDFIKHRLDSVDGSEGPICIGYIGRLEKIKNVNILISALSKLEDKKVTLIVAGIGDEEKNLRRQVSTLGLDDRVEFIGFIQGEEKKSFFEQIDVMVVPSTYEPFGIVVLEGMARGVLVIGSNTGGIKEIIENGKTGLLFENGSIESLVSVLSIVVGRRGLVVDMIENARKEVINHYSWKRVAQDYKRVIDVAISED